jgi:hypothetical protein
MKASRLYYLLDTLTTEQLENLDLHVDGGFGTTQLDDVVGFEYDEKYSYLIIKTDYQESEDYDEDDQPDDDIPYDADEQELVEPCGDMCQLPEKDQTEDDDVEIKRL